ncbi:hypothetical protein VOLCADRAFT_91880 [Volvox carteri f. nagariensis]|uniref:Uncharacterized protein n=1 Tax=Volvox carteri f. nagariensis TaxID=3068 RepID=D8TY72_VOLCA|nr:uncharacterized protein VOLCADRAFT_91880 [Volvox carteri f. nagariensis]EFJ47595.1 hypothetical protein VOLCADRAFT_91880 [Volvox carteri f. nagariensis]|eukprot:XP_002951419.1 hypothetical protein VOLCADRAFT_91880 [Volvox carteri f. nagariensis]
MARPLPSLYGALQSLFASHVHVRNAASAVAGGGSLTESGGDFVEVAVTPEELPSEVKEALSRTLALVAGTTSARDTRRILQDHYAKFAIFESNVLWCPHSIGIATWMAAARLLTLPYVECIRCHRIVLRRVSSSSSAAAAVVALPGAAGAGSGAQPSHQGASAGLETAAQGAPTPEVHMQMDAAFAWRPLAPLHHLLQSWGIKGLQLPTITTEHTITLTINTQSRVVQHRDITHNFPSAPLPLKGVLGLPTPLIATVLHV